MTHAYADDGSRVPFDPLRVSRHLTGCILCGAPVAVVGIFVPQTDRMRRAVLLMREHPVREGSTMATAYGLCRRHAANLDLAMERVEQAILAAAAKVVVQHNHDDDAVFDTPEFAEYEARSLEDARRGGYTLGSGWVDIVTAMLRAGGQTVVVLSLTDHSTSLTDDDIPF